MTIDGSVNQTVSSDVNMPADSCYIGWLQKFLVPIHEANVS